MFEKRIWVISLFPEIINTYFSHGVISRFNSCLEVINPSSYSPKGFKGVDDTPFGGGPGVVMRGDVLSDVLEEGIFKHYSNPKKELLVIFTSPVGKKWDSNCARVLSENLSNQVNSSKDLVFVCGRYEGIDQRFIDAFVDQVYSVGDYVLTGGELAVLAMIDSTLRFVPGALGNPKSYEEDSFENNLMDYPKWTKPRIFKGISVPEVLLSGNHQKIEDFNNSLRPKI